MDTWTSASVVSAAWASASLAFSALRLPPKISGSQLASSPALKLLLASLSPDLLRPAGPEALTPGSMPAVLTSRRARDCCSAACAERMLVLAFRACVTKVLKRGSLNPAHHCASELDAAGTLPGDTVVDHCVGTSTADAATVVSDQVAQPLRANKAHAVSARGLKQAWSSPEA